MTVSGFQKAGPQPCFYCGNVACGYDHVVARARGGSDDGSNLVPACETCNSRKRDLSVEEFRLFLQLVDRQYPITFYGENRAFPPRDYIFLSSRPSALLAHNMATGQ